MAYGMVLLVYIHTLLHFNVLYRKGQHIFLPYRFTDNIIFCHYFTWLVFKIYSRRVMYNLGGSFFFGSVRQTDLLAILLLSVPIYVIKFLRRITFL